MSVSDLSEKTKIILWGLAAGRCQYRGCNSRLYEDPLTKAQFNQAYIAHIVADRSEGPRGDVNLSPILAKNINNLMLLCDRHHRLIDKEDVEGHPVDLLILMKSEHERRISLQTNIQTERATELILFSSNIGPNAPHVNYQKASTAVLQQGWYPSSSDADTIRLGYRNSYVNDDDSEFWRNETENLHRQVDQCIRPRMRDHGISHLSIFAVAPMPLLIELGRLLSDVSAAEVYQLHREPRQDWLWQEHEQDTEFQIIPPTQVRGDPAVVISLSAMITPDRVEAVLGQGVSIWNLKVDNPHTSLIKSRAQLGQFRLAWRELLNQVIEKHGAKSIMHLFPAVPVSAAVEIGRIWQPKADLSISIYDQNQLRGGFIHALDLENKLDESGN